MAVGGGRVPPRWPAVRRRGSNIPPGPPHREPAKQNKKDVGPRLQRFLSAPTRAA
jgi:hypothetical protein